MVALSFHYASYLSQKYEEQEISQYDYENINREILQDPEEAKLVSKILKENNNIIRNKDLFTINDVKQTRSKRILLNEINKK